MTRLFESTALLLTVTLCMGCDSHASLGDDTPPPPPPPVTDQERDAIEVLQQRGADIDLDEAGHVRIVELIKSQATDADLKLLSCFPCLEACDITAGSITEAGLPHLKPLKGLQRLYLNDLPIGSDSMVNLADMTKLDVLSLRNTQVDDKGLAHLKKLRQLTVLNLSKTAITNKGLESLRGLQKLDTLVLADTAVTGAGFATLKALKNLRTLNMDRCENIDGYLMDLSGLRELRMLYVHGCTVSEDEVEELTDDNPRLAVFGY
jgi:hypothetical protein